MERDTSKWVTSKFIIILCQTRRTCTARLWNLSKYDMFVCKSVFRTNLDVVVRAIVLSVNEITIDTELHRVYIYKKKKTINLAIYYVCLSHENDLLYQTATLKYNHSHAKRFVIILRNIFNQKNLYSIKKTVRYCTIPIREYCRVILLTTLSCETFSLQMRTADCVKSVDGNL